MYGNIVSMVKNTVIVLLSILLVATIAWKFIDKGSEKTINTVATPSVVASITPSPVIAVTTTPTPTSTPSSMGTVSGKLCYPSQFLPEGSIDAKDTVTKKVISEPFIGSQAGGKANFTLNLPEGTYIFRYLAKNTPNTTLSGFYTKTCPTGIETSCAQANVREHLEVKVLAGKAVEGVNLCDFYYDPNKVPAF